MLFKCIRIGLATLFTAVLSSAIQAREGNKSPVKIVDEKKAFAAIVYPNDMPLYSLVADRLAGYIENQTGVRLPATTGNNFELSRKITTIILDGTKDKSMLRKYGLTVDLKSERSDAYSIKVVQHNNMPFIILAGNSAEGVKFAAYRLMEELNITGTSTSIKQMDIKAEPFFKTRIISMGNIWRTAIEIERKYNIEGWSADRLKKSVNMYDAFGFNGFEILDRFNDGYLVPCYGITRQEWRNKIWSMADNAHLNGQKFFLRAWGNAVMDIPGAFKSGPNAVVPRIFKSFCPDLPDDRKRWESEIRDYYVPNYASHIDNFIGHWSDAGGCKDPKSNATVKDAMLLHMELENAFKKINPKLETSFSFWHMDEENWRGYKDYRSVSGASVLDKDVILAQATRAKSKVYSEKMTEDFVAYGYRAAVWTWIQADSESFNNDASMIIRTHRLGEYFSNLPASAKVLEWHNIERCQHGLGNVVNYYVAGKLMWNPKANVDDILKSFAVKMFGEQNAPHIVEAYNALEALRVSDNRIRNTSPKNPEQMAIQSQTALKSLEKVKIDPKFRPRLELDITAQQIKDDLINALTVINAYSLCFSNELPELDNAKKENNTEEQEKIVKSLRNKISLWGSSIAGLFEARAMEQELKKRGYPGGSKKNRRTTQFLYNKKLGFTMKIKTVTK